MQKRALIFNHKSKLFAYNSFYNTFISLIKKNIGEELFAQIEDDFRLAPDLIQSNALSFSKITELKELIKTLKPVFCRRSAIKSAHLGDLNETITSLLKLHEICQKSN